MTVFAILLLAVGKAGLALSTMMFGDIGIAAAIAALTALLSGAGLLFVVRSHKTLLANQASPGTECAGLCSTASAGPSIDDVQLTNSPTQKSSALDCAVDGFYSDYLTKRVEALSRL